MCCRFSAGQDLLHKSPHRCIGKPSVFIVVERGRQLHLSLNAGQLPHSNGKGGARAQKKPGLLFYWLTHCTTSFTVRRADRPTPIIVAEANPVHPPYPTSHSPGTSADRVPSVGIRPRSSCCPSGLRWPVA